MAAIFDATTLSIPPDCLVSPFTIEDGCLISPDILERREERDAKISALVADFLLPELFPLIGEYDHVTAVKIVATNDYADFKRLDIRQQNLRNSFTTRLLYPNNWKPENSSEMKIFVLATDDTFNPDTVDPYLDNPEGPEYEDYESVNCNFAVAFQAHLNPNTLFAAYNVFYNLIYRHDLNGPGMMSNATPPEKIKASKEWQKIEHALWP